MPRGHTNCEQPHHLYPKADSNVSKKEAQIFQSVIGKCLGKSYKLPDNTKMLKRSRFYTKPLDASNIPTLAEGSTKIIVKNDDNIMLGAFGCGAFHNPPKHIARLFHEVIDEKEFKDKYKLIAFAILEDHNSPRGGNLQPFIEEFKS